MYSLLGQHANFPQFGGVVSEATLDIRMQFIRKVYAILYDLTPLYIC
jgi:hypothetical protein